MPLHAPEIPPTAVEPPYRGFAVGLVHTQRLSPSFLRLTFTGEDLDRFGTTTLDQRIKLVLPASCGTAVDPGGFADPRWFDHWRTMPETERPRLRTYTVRAVRPHSREVDVDVVLHGVEPGDGAAPGCRLGRRHACVHAGAVGPAVRWSATAQPGDPLVIVGPNARFDGPTAGVEWQPPAGAHSFLIAGDETALPAICSIVEQLDPGARAEVVLEVPHAEDRPPLPDLPGVAVHVLARDRAQGPPAGHGELLERQARTSAARLVAGRPAGDEPEDVDVDSEILWEVPDGARAADGLYAWIAGEAAAVKAVRRYLVRDLGLDRRSVAFMGYWRLGRSEGS